MTNERTGRIARITLDRPSRGNGITGVIPKAGEIGVAVPHRPERILSGVSERVLQTMATMILVRAAMCRREPPLLRRQLPSSFSQRGHLAPSVDTHRAASLPVVHNPRRGERLRSSARRRCGCACPPS
jgi:hypothetical protein